MKRFVLFTIAVLIAATLLACVPMEAEAYNRSIFDTKYSFTEAIVFRADGEEHVKVKTWCDYENSDMIQITLDNGTTYLTHSSNVILVSP